MDRSSLIILTEAMSDPASVPVYSTDDGYNYVTAEAVENYMLCSGTIEIYEAMSDIAKANEINSDKLYFVGYFEEDFLPDDEDHNSEALAEKAVEDNAMSVAQAERYYNTVIKTCKSKAKSREAIEECIKVLKECVKDMERELEDAQTHLLHGGRIKYALKSIIPFNSIYRLFKHNDWEAELSDLAGYGLGAGTMFVVTNKVLESTSIQEDGFDDDGDITYSSEDEDDDVYVDEADTSAKLGDVVKAAAKKKLKDSIKPTPWKAVETGAGIVFRLATYTSMLKRMIKKTKAAIDYLEDKKKELGNRGKKKTTNKSIHEDEYSYYMEHDDELAVHILNTIIPKIDSKFEWQVDELLNSKGYKGRTVYINHRFEDKSSDGKADLYYNPFTLVEDDFERVLSPLLAPIINFIKANIDTKKFSVTRDKSRINTIHIKSISE